MALRQLVFPCQIFLADPARESSRTFHIPGLPRTQSGLPAVTDFQHLFYGRKVPEYSNSNIPDIPVWLPQN